MILLPIVTKNVSRCMIRYPTVPEYSTNCGTVRRRPQWCVTSLNLPAVVGRECRKRCKPSRHEIQIYKELPVELLVSC
jgi:hypothetical protein